VKNKINLSAPVQCLLEGGFPGITSDLRGGLILVRELDERLGVEKFIEEHSANERFLSRLANSPDSYDPAVHTAH
jgi:hypothetical protein